MKRKHNGGEDAPAVEASPKDGAAALSGIPEGSPAAVALSAPSKAEPPAAAPGEDAPKAEPPAPKEDAPVEGEAEEEGLTLRDHLMALRKVIVISLIAVGVAFLAAFYFIIDPLMTWITDPIKARGVTMIYTAASEALMTKLKVAVVTAIVIAFPVIIWQIWSFIKPALYPKEQRSFRIFFFFALLLFLLGIVFCYASVFFLAIDFFMISGEGLAEPMLSLDKYISFLFGFLLPFGVAFMLPVFIYITTRIGLTTPEMLASKRKFVILGIFVMAAILTPPDVVSQVMLGIPMLLLYEVGILVSRMVKKKARE